MDLIEANFYEALEIANELAFFDGYSKEEFLTDPERFLNIFETEITKILEFRNSTRCLETKEILQSRWYHYTSGSKFSYDLFGIDPETNKTKCLAVVNYREQLLAKIRDYRDTYPDLYVFIPTIRNGYPVQGNIENIQTHIDTLKFIWSD